MFAYCNNEPVASTDPTGHYIGHRPIMVCDNGSPRAALMETLMLMRKKYTGLANCYAFSIKLPTDPQTGEPFQKRPQPGDFSDGYASPDLDGFMEKVYNECDADLEGLSKNIINAVIEDGQVLGFTITKADSANACANGQSGDGSLID